MRRPASPQRRAPLPAAEMSDCTHQFAQLLTAIERQVGTNRFAVGFIGCEAGVGTTTVARSFCEYLERRHPGATVYIETDWRPLLGQGTSTPSPRVGLSEVVLGQAQLDVAVERTGGKNASFAELGSGNATAFSLAEAPLLGASVQATLEALRDRFDYVVVDIAPMGIGTFASVLAPLLDGLIMVIECEASHWEVADAAVEAIDSIGAKMIGAVLNKKRYHIPTWLYRLL